MKVAIRVDASLQMGTGHVMRCKTLADQLRTRNANVRFICRQLPGNMISFLTGAGYDVTTLPLSNVSGEGINGDYQSPSMSDDLQMEDAYQTIDVLNDFSADWLIVDNYQFDIVWERLIRPYTKSISVIDDLADREHDCDVLLDQNLYQNIHERYKELVSKDTVLLLGPRFVLLRPEFYKASKTLADKDGSVRKILVFFGGVDKTCQTEKVIEAISQVDLSNVIINIIVGSGNLSADKISNMCSELMNVVIHHQVSNMAELIADSDFSIGAGGATTWERCFLGLPSATIIVAPNQSEATIVLDGLGATWNLGWHENVTADMIAEKIQEVCSDSDALLRMRNLAFQIMDKTETNDLLGLCETMFKLNNDWYSHLDSNQGPKRYERCALTN